MIRSVATTGDVTELCRALDVSRSGYYGWRNGGRGRRAEANRVLMTHITTIYTQKRAVYGSLRVTDELHRRGLRCGHNRVARLMRQNGLRGAQRRSFRPKTTDSQHEYPVSPNRLQDAPKVTTPNQVWVTDITYIPTDEGWGYLAGVMDLATRTLKGWAISDSLKSKVVTDAFCQAVFRYRPPTGLIVHSDRGSQYAGREYRRLLEEHKALSSMSRKANCYDNAAMESFWATLKTELAIREPFMTLEHARLALFDYIETFYNRQRSHSALGYLAPLVFEAQFDPKNTNPLLSVNSG